MIISIVGRSRDPQGVQGSAGSGKDTVADMLVSKHGFISIALADPIKRILFDLFGFSREQLWGPSHLREEPNLRYGGLTVRHAAQALGTEWARACYEDVWLQYMWRTAQDVLLRGMLYSKERGTYDASAVEYMRARYCAGIAVPDIRFPNEVQYLRAKGGHVILLRRPVEHVTRATHASETSLDHILDDDPLWGTVIDNDGTLDDLQVKVSCAVKRLKEQDGPTT